jgi:hypothetical protein
MGKRGGKGKRGGTGKRGGARGRAKAGGLTARTADVRALYEASVQSPESELDFVEQAFRKLRGRRPVSIREDFCGSAFTSSTWVKRRAGNRAVGVDLDADALAWGERTHTKDMTDEQRSRLTLVHGDVRTPAREGRGVDCVLAMNFSHWIFKTREELRDYFRAVRKSLGKEGVFFCDHTGGWACYREQVEKRRLKGFTYEWEQVRYDPLSGVVENAIHFSFPDGTRKKRAFTYDWRLWSVPEVRELLAEAGFSRSTVHWEGDDGKGAGNGVFRPATEGEACESWIAYIVSEP